MGEEHPRENDGWGMLSHSTPDLITLKKNGWLGEECQEKEIGEAQYPSTQSYGRAWVVIGIQVVHEDGRKVIILNENVGQRKDVRSV